MGKGKHPEKALKGTQLTQAKPGQHADGGGLYLVVEPTGAKHWIFRAVVNGKRRKFGLGSTRDVTVTEARERAAEYRKLNRSGVDLVAHLKREKMPSFRKAAEAVHAEFKASWKNEKHAAQWISTLETYAFPVIGDKPVNEIGTSHVHAVLSPIWLEKPETARRLRQRMRTVLDWCKGKQFVTGENPVDSVSAGTRTLPKQGDTPRHMAALPYVEIPAFIAALRAHDAVAEIIRLAFEFCVLTASRSNEVRFTRRTDVADNVWTVPAERMKAKKEHRVPLSARCVQIVERAIELGGNNDLLFPNPLSGKALSENALLNVLVSMGRAKEVTVHGFRSAFRDWCAERTAFPAMVAEMALAHAIKDKVEAAYLRTKLFDQRRELMTAWEAFVLAKPAQIVLLHAIGDRE